MSQGLTPTVLVQVLSNARTSCPGVSEYVSVLTSIVVGLGIAHLLHGVATIVQHLGRRRIYWVHLTWVAFMFFQAIFFWWWEFALESLEQ